MAEHIWDDLLTERDRQVIAKAGYDEAGASSWDSRGLGTDPLVLVIDIQRFVVGEDEPILDAIEDYRTAMAETADHGELIADRRRQSDFPPGGTDHRHDTWMRTRATPTT